MPLKTSGLTGFPNMGMRVDTAIVYHPRTITYDPVEELPTSEPGTAQVQIVSAANDLPTYSPILIPAKAGEPVTDTWIKQLYVHVQNTGVSAATVYAKSKSANTPTWSSASSVSVAAGYYATFTSRGISSWALGDTEEIKLYASAAGVKLLTAWLVFFPGVLGTGLPTRCVDVDITISADSLLGGTTDGTAGAWEARSSIFTAQEYNTSFTGALFNMHSTSGFGYAAIKTNAWSSTTSSSTPRHWCPKYPTRVAFTPIL